MYYSILMLDNVFNLVDDTNNTILMSFKLRTVCYARYKLDKLNEKLKVYGISVEEAACNRQGVFKIIKED